MSVGALGFYGVNGRIRGAYVYMVFCPIGDQFFVKVGMSNSPAVRLGALRTACPIEPTVMAVVEMPSQGLAASLERATHGALIGWRTHGEWFRVDKSDKKRFSEAAHGVLRAYAKPSWPLKWTQVSIKAVLADGLERQRAARRKFAHSERTFREFVKALHP